MKLQTDIRLKRIILVFSLVFCLGTKAQLVQMNPTQWAAIESGYIAIDKEIKKEIQDETLKDVEQGGITLSVNEMSGWQRKYNEYLKTATGFAESLKAGSMLYLEGVKTLREMYSLYQATEGNPQGIGASVAMNDLTIEVTAELVKTYRLLKFSVSAGTKANMLTGAQRTELMWELQNQMGRLNSKLRALSLTIRFYNLRDVIDHYTTGFGIRDRRDIAEASHERWIRAARRIR